MKLGLIGCGAIGSFIAKQIPGIPGISLLFIFDINREKAEKITYFKKPKFVGIRELIKKADLVIEAASVAAVKEILPLVVKEKRDLIVMSVGGLLGEERLLKKAEEKRVKIYVPSGAIAGIDGLKAARQGNIESVLLTTRKPPLSLKDAPYILENKIDILNIKEENTIFKGTALDAIKGFPANINVSATLSLAGIGQEKTFVKIIADPNIDKNIHEVLIKGDFGAITVKCENLPSPDNPKTSYLASLSCIALLKSIGGGLKIGT